jgi:hypothetical protein
VELAPVTSNLAAVTVPGTFGRVTPPVNVRFGLVVAGKVTVPIVLFIEMLPNAMSNVLVMLIGVIIVAAVVAVAETCANEVATIPEKRIIRTKIFFMFFIGEGSFLVYSFVCFFPVCLMKQNTDYLLTQVVRQTIFIL